MERAGKAGEAGEAGKKKASTFSHPARPALPADPATARVHILGHAPGRRAPSRYDCLFARLTSSRGDRLRSANAVALQGGIIAD
jgi:hypothetical protein